MWNEVLNRESFDTRLEAQILVEWWRREYYQVRSHYVLGYRLLAAETIRIPRLEPVLIT